MPSSRVTIIFVALVIVGLGYLFFFESHFESTTQHELLKNRVLKLVPDEVQRIKIKRDAWTSALIERVDAQDFRAVEPVEGKADSASIFKLLSGLEFMESKGIPIKDRNTEQIPYSYGLSPAQLEVDLALNEGREIRLAFGNTTSVGNDVYLSIFGTAPVYEIDEKIFNDANRLLDITINSTQGDTQERSQE